MPVTAPIVRHLHRAAGVVTSAILLASCASAPAPTNDPNAASAAAAPAAPPVTEAKAPERPQLTGPAARFRVQHLVRQILESLNEGDEERARTDLEEARLLEPENKTVNCLQRGISADPVAALGRESTPYTVQGGETLGRIAQRALGDTCEFYLLARYNQIRVPKQVAVGQVLRIPGKVALAAPESGSTRKPVEAPPSDTRTPPTAAGPAVIEAASKPATPTASPRADIERHHRAAQAAFRRQDLATAIREWGKVLELDPNNELARARRQEAIDLERRLKQMK
jgi:hypothetical protein